MLSLLQQLKENDHFSISHFKKKKEDHYQEEYIDLGIL